MPKPFFENKNKKLQEIIRVNHAGEFGAAAIYRGQIRYTKNPSDIKLLSHMLEQEQEHLDYFSDKIKDGQKDCQSRPTILMPVWKIAGYLMGAVSAKIGIKSAMLVTENVETVIEEHYQEQIEYLEKYDAKNPMLTKIRKFQAEEIEHKNIAADDLYRETSPTRRSLHYSKLIQTACKVAIFLSKKF